MMKFESSSSSSFSATYSKFAPIFARIANILMFFTFHLILFLPYNKLIAKK